MLFDKERETPCYAWHKTLYQQGFTAFPVAASKI